MKINIPFSGLALVLAFACAVQVGCADATPNVFTGMSASELEAKCGSPLEKRVMPDGRQEWYYNVTTKSIQDSTAENMIGSVQVGVTKSRNIIYETSPAAIVISPSAKVESPPDGHVESNR